MSEWIGAGVGAHSWGCGQSLSCAQSRELGYTLIAGAAARLHRLGGVGIEVSYFRDPEPNYGRSQLNASLVVQALAEDAPSRSVRPFALVGAGLSRIASLTPGTSPSWGLGLTVRLGIRVRVSDGWGVAPSVGLATAPHSDFTATVLRGEVALVHW